MNGERIKTPDDRLQRHPLGFYQIKDPPSSKELEQYYRDMYFQSEKGSYRKKYSQDELAYLNVQIARKAWLAEQITERKKGRFIDVGCGEGFALVWFEKRGWKVEGLDFSSVGVKRMNPDYLDKLQTGNILQLIEKRIEHGKEYDLLWLNNVLEHSIDPVGLLTSLRKIVAGDGCLIVTVPNDCSMFQESLLEWGDIGERFWITPPDHLSYFSYDSLKGVAEAVGWKCAKVIADFPIDWYLMHPGSNYIKHGNLGKAAHQARVKAELYIGSRSHEKAVDFYCSLARLGMGRNLTAFLQPNRPRASRK